MSGYASKREAEQVVRDTMIKRGANPQRHVMSRIYARLIYSRGRRYGWGIAGDADEFDAAVANAKRNGPE